MKKIFLSFISCLICYLFFAGCKPYNLFPRKVTYSVTDVAAASSSLRVISPKLMKMEAYKNTLNFFVGDKLFWRSKVIKQAPPCPGPLPCPPPKCEPVGICDDIQIHFSNKEKFLTIGGSNPVMLVTSYENKDLMAAIDERTFNCKRIK